MTERKERERDPDAQRAEDERDADKEAFYERLMEQQEQH